ncbi:hypothetical protein X744_32300 [Mesorhizobium sp. LNJC372A00]|nr:hypothetical protein X745_32350 [Mesorhizobium sp. LNJC374B00]ESY48923.1 hypothetical protein X744_32300 [Mesorhizobium sp. LNJC372A00]
MFFAFSCCRLRGDPLRAGIIDVQELSKTHSTQRATILADMP